MLKAVAETAPAPGEQPGARVIVERADLMQLIAALRARGYTVLGPTVRNGAIVIAALAGVEDLPAGWTDEQDGGTYRLNAQEQAIPSGFFRYSSHAFSLAEAVELTRALGELPPRLIVYGIEGADYAAGMELSSVVAHAAEEVAQPILTEVRQQGSAQEA